MNKAHFATLITFWFVLVFCLLVFLPLWIFMIIGAILIMVLGLAWKYYRNEEGEVKPLSPKDFRVEIIICTILLMGAFIAFIPMPTQQNQGAFFISQQAEVPEEIQAEQFYIVSSEKRSDNGFWEPLNGAIKLPLLGSFYHQLNHSVPFIAYNITIASTLKFSNISLDIYSDTDYIEEGRELLVSQRWYDYDLMRNETRLIDEEYTQVYIWSKIVNLNADSLIFTQFNMTGYMNHTFYAEREVHYAYHWISIEDKSNVGGVYGMTVLHDYSLGSLWENEWGMLAFIAGIFICFFLIVFMIGFFSQNHKLVSTFFFIEFGISIILLMWVFTLTDKFPWLEDIITGILELNNTIGYAWLVQLVAIMRLIGLMCAFFMWFSTIGIALILCYYMGNLITIIANFRD